MKVLAFLFLLFTTHLLLAQSVSSGSTRLDLQKEEDIFLGRLHGFIPLKEKYLYNEFKDGRIFYASRKESNPVKLNFNRYYSHVAMINEKRDTTFVANFEIIKYVLIDNDLYYYDFKKGYFQILSNPDDTIRLVAQRKLKIIKRDLLRDSEQPQVISTKKAFSILYTPLNPTFHRENVILSRDDSYFLMDQNEETYPATRASFLKLFPHLKQKIEDYLVQMMKQRTPIKFHEEKDLEKLLTFCKQQKHS